MTWKKLCEIESSYLMTQVTQTDAKISELLAYVKKQNFRLFLSVSRPFLRIWSKVYADFCESHLLLLHLSYILCPLKMQMHLRG